MIIKLLYQLWRFAIIVLLQVALLNHIQWSGYINPYVYVLFILLLPVELPSWVVMLIGFALGIIVDMFSDSGGMHAAATVFLCFVRPFVLKIMAPRDGFEPETNLGIYKMGFNWFLTYTSILVAVHHLFYFYTEVFRFTEFFITLFKALLNTIVTVIIIILGQYLFSNDKRVK
jgi:rod shape-determining protein MreD